MTEKIKRMSATEPCLCGSRQEWKKCCGKYLEDKTGFATVVPLTGKPAVRFFLCDLPKNDAYAGDNNVVLVFTNRAQALGLNERLGHKYQVIGMSKESWAAFQRDVPNHLVISDAVA